MQKREENSKSRAIFSVRNLTTMALMIALSIVLGKFLAINPTPMIRISLENLPIILSAVMLGPIGGGTVALVADLLGSILRGYEINPIVTIGAVTIGALFGAIFKYTPIKGLIKRLILSVAAAHFFGSVVIKTSGLAVFYFTSYNMGFGTLFLIRLGTYVVTGAVEILIITILLKNKTTKGLLIGAKK